MSLFRITSSAIEDSRKGCFGNGFFLLDGNVIDEIPSLPVENLIFPNFVDMVDRGIKINILK